ncbi:uncharacterized protein [Dermacentor albipictus]|uniref:uncharacterized protein n=1 Tax=Dermacentor albipictus TaxID=60249 RepID=UPI0031FDAD5C
MAPVRRRRPGFNAYLVQERALRKQRRRMLRERAQALRVCSALMDRAERQKSKTKSFCDDVKADADRLREVCQTLMGLVDRNDETWKDFFDRAEEAGAKMERMCASLVNIAETNENMVVQFVQDVQARPSHRQAPQVPEVPPRDSPALP